MCCWWFTGRGATVVLACTELPLVLAAARRAPRWARALDGAALAFVDASALLAEALARRALGLPAAPAAAAAGGGARGDGARGGDGKGSGGGAGDKHILPVAGPSFLKKVE